MQKARFNKQQPCTFEVKGAKEDSGKSAEEGFGEITRNVSTPEQESYRRSRNDGFGKTQREASTPEPACKAA